MAQQRIIRLEADGQRAIRFLTSLPVDIGDKRKATVTITRTGTFTDPRYGKFDITLAMLNTMVKNFRANVIGQDVFIDVAHKHSDGAAAKILSLFVDGSRLRAEVEFTDFGVDAVKKRGFRYLSAEYVEEWT